MNAVHKQMLKILLFYALGLFIGMISGFLPFLSLAAGLPILFVYESMGLPATRLMTFFFLLLTWALADPFSFVFAGLGISIAYALIYWRYDKQGLGTAYSLGLLGSGLWLLLCNLVLKLVEKQSLLTFIVNSLQEAFNLVYENVDALNYSEMQLQILKEMQTRVGPLFSENWPLLVFIFSGLATSVCLLYLSRRRLQVAEYIAAWSKLKASPVVAAMAIITFLANKFAPRLAPFWVENGLHMGFVVLFFAGISLSCFYLKHFRFGRIMSMLLILYLIITPWLKPVLILLGLFDALFDYRYFVQAKG